MYAKRSLMNAPEKSIAGKGEKPVTLRRGRG